MKAFCRVLAVAFALTIGNGHAGPYVPGSGAEPLLPVDASDSGIVAWATGVASFNPGPAGLTDFQVAANALGAANAASLSASESIANLGRGGRIVLTFDAPIVDGAGAALIGSGDMGERLDLRPRARIRACASVGTDPTLMLTGPTPSAQIALRKAGMSKSDIDLFELNEAFASVVLLFMQEMDVPHEQINVNGGAIAMGHPIGATGVMILGTVLDELERRGLGTALVNLCVGAGMGTATIIERI